MKLVRKHTERFTKETLQNLLDAKTSPCVSLYMPTHKISNEAEQDPIRLKNLLSTAEDALAAQEVRKPDIDSLLEPIQMLMDDHEFWQYQSHGLALFRSPGHFESYRLPIKFDEFVTTNERFHVKPLLPLLSGNGRFYLLALSQNKATLYEGTRFRIGEVELGDDIPTSLNEAMRFDEFESQLHAHTRTAPRGTGDNAMYYGMSDAGDEAVIKENIKRFLNTLDKGIKSHLSEENAPLVLAGVDYMCGLYREESQYANILDETVEGNPDLSSPEELHKKAWSIVEPHFDDAKSNAVDQFMQLTGSDDERGSASLDEIVAAAYFQRIDTLFVPLGKQKWGTFDPEKNQVAVHEEREPDNHDLFDFAASHTIINGGTVYALEPAEIPRKAEIAAIFRY